MIPKDGGKRRRRQQHPGLGGAFVTRKGALRIRKAGYADAGVYTCRGEDVNRGDICDTAKIKQIVFRFQPRTRPRPLRSLSSVAARPTTSSKVTVRALQKNTVHREIAN